MNREYELEVKLGERDQQIELLQSIVKKLEHDLTQLAERKPSVVSTFEVQVRHPLADSHNIVESLEDAIECGLADCDRIQFESIARK